MAKEICISSTPHETRLAILEDDQLSEIYYERENEYTLAGSIYKGRVTRVLPGMQSAFVDIGLERDAFLYVTDFLELEEPEDADELERATTQGTPIRQQTGNDGSRRQSGGGREPRSAAAAPNAPTQNQTLNIAPVSSPSEATEGLSADESAAGDTDDASGTRRWRGRRRRRGGRRDEPEEATSSVSDSGQVTGGPQSSVAEFEIDPSVKLNAGATHPVGDAPQPDSRRGRSAATSAPAFVLPGESLARYGGVPEAEPSAAAAKPAAKASPAPPAFKPSRPSTLIETEIQWDGTGLLPGESLARHRGQSAAPAAPATLQASASSSAQSNAQENEVHAASVEGHTAEPAAASPQIVEEFVEEEFSEEEIHEASARHDVDPIPPSTFRLKDLFGGRRRSETAEPGKKPTVRGVSAFSPGSGHVEEEEIEAEEYDLSHHALRVSDEHDSSDLEEETLQQQVRSGVIGEMLHEVQLETHQRPVRDGESGSPRDGSGRGRGGQSRNRGRGGRGRDNRESRDSREPREGRSSERSTGEARRPMTRRAAQTSDLPIISDLLKPGQEILVQIAKEPIAQKGARITSHIALPGRFLVFMPTVSHVGVSRKIESDEERQRLKRILLSERGEATGGFIVRTAAEGASEDELRADLRFLIHLWSEIRQRADSSRPPALIYHDLNLIERILRDQVSDNFSHIWVDSEADYERIVRFLNRFSPELVRRVKLYNKELPLFEHFGIQDEISKALRSKVWLKSGGSIVINQTEALVAIDINTGKYVGKTARLEDTILRTNLDAIPEIVRQIRLRDLGGIIVIDFIDMDERRNRARVLTALEEALKQDRAPTKVLQFNDFGLVAITRKRVKQSLERTLSVPCPVCQATGMVKSPTTVANEIYSEMRKMRRHFEQSEITLRVHPETAKVLKSGNARWLGEFESLTGKSVLVKNDATLHPEQFDIQG